jgi:hypothetical protein
VISVTPRARRRREDRGGDPLDGLVNLFDLGIVLAVGFLLAALASLKLSGQFTHHGLKPVSPSSIQISPGETISPLPSPGARVQGPGTKVGTVYRLPDGRLVYVTTASPAPAVTPSPGAVVTPSPDATTPIPGTTSTPGTSAGP